MWRPNLVTLKTLQLVPWHRDFDGLISLQQDRKLFGWNEDLDAARSAWRFTDQACPLEREDHLVHGRRCEAEIALNVAFGGRLPVDAGIGVDERQILALLGGEAGRDLARHLIHRSIHLGLHDGGCDECTLSCQAEPR